MWYKSRTYDGNRYIFFGKSLHFSGFNFCNEIVTKVCPFLTSICLFRGWKINKKVP